MLPQLPKQNKHKEADFGSLFRTYVEKHMGEFIGGSYELKDSRGKDSISFAEVTKEQISSALRCEKGNLIRIVVGKPDGSADFVLLKNDPAYFVIKFPTTVSFITIRTFLLEKENSKRKSLTEKRAGEISIKTLKKADLLK